MGNFSYQATGPTGRHLSGTIAAPNREAALDAIRKQGNRPLSVVEAEGDGSKLNFTIGGKKVKSRELVIFTRELSTMVSAGVPLPRSLSTLADQAESKYFKEVVSTITHDIESGTPLAEAMAKFPKAFNDVYVNMVRAGEAGGILDDILKRLASQVEKDAGMRKKIKSAMAYPTVILVVTIIAFFGIMLFVLPKIGAIIKDLGGEDAELPSYSRMMLDSSAFIQKNIIFILVFMFITIFLFRRYIKTESGKYNWHKFLLRVPVFGKIIAKIAIARFSRIFASLMSSGVNVLEALEVTGRAVGNKVIQRELEEVAKEVKNGQPLGKQLLTAPFFPPIVGQMMSVGEETGQIDQILVKVADFYEEEVDTVIDGLASIIEPIMIVVLGGLVGLIAASVMGPIASLSKNIGG